MTTTSTSAATAARADKAAVTAVTRGVDAVIRAVADLPPDLSGIPSFSAPVVAETLGSAIVALSAGVGQLRVAEGAALRAVVAAAVESRKAGSPAANEAEVMALLRDDGLSLAVIAAEFGLTPAAVAKKLG